MDACPALVPTLVWHMHTHLQELQGVVVDAEVGGGEGQLAVTVGEMGHLWRDVRVLHHTEVTTDVGEHSHLSHVHINEVIIQ